MLTKEQMDRLTKLLAEIEKQHPLSSIRAENVHKLQMQALPLAATVIEQQAEIERLRALVTRAQGLLDPCYPHEHEQWQKDALSINAMCKTSHSVKEQPQ